jgi:hypothetical protein
MGTNYHTAWAASVTQFTAASMNPAIAALDKGITYGTKRPIVTCDGNIKWENGTLTWDSTIRIFFVREDGVTIQNTISAGNIALSDNEFAYVDLNETNDTILTVQKSSVSGGSASNFITINRLVLCYRNTTNDELYPVFIPMKFRDPDIMVQTITCADNVTIDWKQGSTAIMTFDRANVNFTFTGGFPGQRCVLILVQDATGSRTLTFGTEVRDCADLAAPPSLSGVSLTDYLGFIYNGTVSKYDFVSMMKGF